MLPQLILGIIAYNISEEIGLNKVIRRVFRGALNGVSTEFKELPASEARQERIKTYYQRKTKKGGYVDVR